MENRVEILKLLADDTRLKILNILLGEDSYVEKIACDLGLTPATVCYHLKKLESAGIVNCSRSQFYIIYSINREIFEKPLYELVRFESAVDPEERYKKSVISNFFKCGKLINLPKQQKKREIVLREIATAFEKGRDYAEADVNTIIHLYSYDHCTIRREMIGFGIMERENGIYRLKDE
ncbi:MAG: metalloregulator ArsR/SmtB family transcription factor [Clostridia bacterium]|nr:metalloregulator ArsR/SmtB family transcription factor [Clostridia bacterium]